MLLRSFQECMGQRFSRSCTGCFWGVCRWQPGSVKPVDCECDWLRGKAEESCNSFWKVPQKMSSAVRGAAALDNLNLDFSSTERRNDTRKLTTTTTRTTTTTTTIASSTTTMTTKVHDHVTNWFNQENVRTFGCDIVEVSSQHIRYVTYIFILLIVPCYEFLFFFIFFFY